MSVAVPQHINTSPKFPKPVMLAHVGPMLACCFLLAHALCAVLHEIMITHVTSRSDSHAHVRIRLQVLVARRWVLVLERLERRLQVPLVDAPADDPVQRGSVDASVSHNRTGVEYRASIELP